MDASAPSPLRNLSLTAGKTEPDLPNRSPRPRLRSIRWVKPFVDQPEVYALGPGRTTAPPVYPTMPALLGVHCTERGALSLSLAPRGVYKEPHVVLSFVNDRARNYLESRTGDYFAYVLVTAHNEMAVVSFDLRGGNHRPILTIEDGAIQSQQLQASEHAPAPIEVTERAQQGSETAPASYPPAPLSAGDQAAQGTTLPGSNYSPAPLLMGDRAVLMQALLSGESRPIVTIGESAAQMMTQAGGEHFLTLQIQTLLEQAAQDLMSGQGNHATTDVTVSVNEQGALGVTTDTGEYVSMFPLDTMETYSSGDFVDGLNGGRTWPGAYVARTNFAGIQVLDTMASYTDGSTLNTLNGGEWTSVGPYVARDNLNTPGLDTMESYTDGAALNGLNAGSGFSGAYVGAENFIRVYTNDTFQTYAVEDPLTSTLSDGYGWSAAWSFPDASPNNVVFSGGGASDTFDDYASESPVTSSLNSGSGWSGAWVIV